MHHRFSVSMETLAAHTEAVFPDQTVWIWADVARMRILARLPWMASVELLVTHIDFSDARRQKGDMYFICTVFSLALTGIYYFSHLPVRLRKVKSFAWSHTTNKRQSWDLYDALSHSGICQVLKYVNKSVGRDNFLFLISIYSCRDRNLKLQLNTWIPVKFYFPLFLCYVPVFYVYVSFVSLLCACILASWAWAKGCVQFLECVQFLKWVSTQPSLPLHPFPWLECRCDGWS